MAINYTTLFTELGLIFAAQDAINASRGSTVPPLIKAIVDEFDSASLEFKQAISGVEPALRAYQSGADGSMSALRTAATNILIEHAASEAGTPLTQANLQLALDALIFDMLDDSESVDASTVGVSASANSGNGDGVLVVSAKRGDGLISENVFAEVLRVLCTDDASPATATFTAETDPAVGNQLSHEWPGGSGSSIGLTAVSANSSLLTNGDFDDEDDVANAPDDWIISVGTIGTTVKMTDYEVQEIAVTGPPTAGTYRINWPNPAGKTQTTVPLAFDATATAVQAALRALEGLESVTVESTGTSPLFTHAITFVGVAGNLSQVTVTNSTTGGTYTPSTTTTGSANAFIGKAVELDSDGSQLTTLNQPVSLAPLTQYAFNIWMLADVPPAAGVITIDLIDGIGGSVIADNAGTNNSFTVDCTALTTSFVAKNGTFRTPRVLPPIVYLRIRISTGVSAGTSIYLDHAALVATQPIYAGGPEAVIFSGKTPFASGSGQVNPDEFTLTVTNNAAGKFQTAFERNFLMREKGLLLPSNAGGSETIADY